MIKKIQLTKFKQFSSLDKELHPQGLTIVAGGNNSGKSSLLHALAVWEFAKLFIELEKGRTALNSGYRGEGVGIAFDDFTPINIPSLKYLWTNLKDLIGYKLKIKCFWDLPDKPNRYLEISFSLVSERLYLKNTSSNLSGEDKIPVIAYLPPFAGITDREQWYSKADRRKLVGRGLAGSLLRNSIIEMYQTNERKRKELKGSLTKIPKVALVSLKATDPYERLNSILFEIFKIQLFPARFNSDFQNYVKVELSKGSMDHNRFRPLANYSRRDIMVEGSGFLQWLSVYTYALDGNIDVLLLDEPDAHLHPSLQSLLLTKLFDISLINNKQILMATHSTEIIKFVDPSSILEIKREHTRYLTCESQKTALIAGLGSEYSPIINKLQYFKRVLFIENPSDEKIIREWFRALQYKFPNNLVIWPFASDHGQRKNLFIHLKDHITEIRGISLRDRDCELYESTNPALSERERSDWVENGSTLRYRKWRRWEIENYLLSPRAISVATGQSEEVVRTFIVQRFSMIIPENYLQSERDEGLRVMFDIEGKTIMSGIESEFGKTKFQVAESFLEDDVFEDAKTLIDEIIQLCCD